jgi:hypothetical protein
MSPSFKGIIGVIISVLFFFPWIWMGILHVKVPALGALSIGLVAAIIAVLLGYQARKGGARLWGMIALTLGLISTVLNVVNLIAVSASRS